MILFITRKYPPSIGGMQRLSYELVAELRKLTDIFVISWGYSQVWLPFFVLYASVVAVFLLSRNRLRIKIVHLGDVVLSPMGVLLRFFFRVPISVNAHGLDVTFPNRFYQMLVILCLKRLDLIICNSESTKRECLKRGIPSCKCIVIPIGIREAEPLVDRVEAREIISSKTGRDLREKKLIITVGRLVRRKGVACFIDEVLSKVVATNPDTVYLVVGKGPEYQGIQRVIYERKLAEHVLLLGEVTDDVLAAVYASADLFVMPNLPVPNDSEGFGIVALEASVAGLCVVASRLDGIMDAIIHGKNGFLVEPGDTDGLISIVSRLLSDIALRREFGFAARNFTLTRFAWPNIASLYVAEFQRLSKKAVLA